MLTERTAHTHILAAAVLAGAVLSTGCQAVKQTMREVGEELYATAQDDEPVYVIAQPAPDRLPVETTTARATDSANVTYVETPTGMTATGMTATGMSSTGMTSTRMSSTGMTSTRAAMSRTERAPVARTMPTVEFGSPADDARSGDGATRVGLFGELISAPVPGAGRFDGSANLAQITHATEGGSFDPDLDRTGKLMVFSSTQHRRTADIYMKSTAGRTMTQVTNDPADDVMPAFSPDSHRIAFASNRSGDWNIFHTNVNGDPPVQVTFDGAHELHPTWSPDGKTLAYCKLGAQSGRWEIWMVDVDDSSAPRFLEYGLFPQWNPDPARNKIVFQRARERGSRLFSVWTIDIVNGEALHPTEIVSAATAAALHPAWSPDGCRMVFVTVVAPDRLAGERPQESDVWVISDDGKARTNLTNGSFLNLYPAWGADGAIYFLSDRSGVDNIWAAATGRTFETSDRTAMPLATADPAMGDDEN